MRALHLVLAVALVVPAGALGGVAADADAPAPPPASVSVATPAQADAGDAPAQVTGGVLPPAPPGTVHALGLQPNATNRTDVHGTHVDLGPALGFETASSSTELETLRAVERVDAADGTPTATRRLRAALTGSAGPSARPSTPTSRTRRPAGRSWSGWPASTGPPGR